MRNKKNIIKIASALAISALFSTTTYAQVITTSYEEVGNARTSVFGLGAKIGTAGIGIEGRVALTEQIYGRLGGNYLSYALSGTESESKVGYKVKLQLLTVPLMIDYHPAADSGFRISAGVAYNGNKVTAKATPSKDVKLYGRTYSPKELGTITTELNLGNKVAPIISIGYDNSFLSGSPFSFNAEIGAMYAGTPKLKTSFSGGTAKAEAQLREDVRRDADADKQLKNAKNYLKFFPVVSIGFKFNL